MSRPINESIQTLETSRDNIVEALNAKLGGVDAQLKISEVAEKINSIETGGGGSKINYVSFFDMNEMYYCDIEIVDNESFKIIVGSNPPHENTQLYLIDIINEENMATALKKTDSNKYETDNINIDEFLNKHKDLPIASTIFIQGSESYDVLENVKTEPYVMIGINQRD